MNNRDQKKSIISPVLALIGPTAIGKTDLSLRIAEQFGCEIISVDSMQVYRHMDVGTAKASKDELLRVKHHLIDIVDPDVDYHAAQFVEDALRAIDEIHSRNKLPLLTGGTGLYLKALKKGLATGISSDPSVRETLRSEMEKYGITHLHQQLRECDPLSAKRLHPNDSSRIIRALEVFLTTGIPLSHHYAAQDAQTDSTLFEKLLTIGLFCPRPVLYERINTRAAHMLERGLEEEVKQLLEMGYAKDLKSMQSIGYRHMLNYLSDTWTKKELVENLARDTRRYAKRQITWFTKDPSICWYMTEQTRQVVQLIEGWLAGEGSSLTT